MKKLILVLIIITALIQTILLYSFVTQPTSTPTDVAIILGHAVRDNNLTRRQKLRIQKGVELYNTNKVDYIIGTGGKGPFNKTDTPLGNLIALEAFHQGIYFEKLLYESTSTNTRENAIESLKIVNEHNFRSATIVTSADHMHRAKLIFKDIYPDDIHLEFAISDYYASPLDNFIDFFWQLAGMIKYLLQ